MDTVNVVAFIVIGVLALPLWVLVHIGLRRLYFAHVARFCRRRGFTVSAYREARCNESVLIELDCVDEQQRRRLVRLLVWIFGIREVLGVEDFPDESLPRPSKETEKLMTRHEFNSKREAASRAGFREDPWAVAVWMTLFVAFTAVNLFLAPYMDEANVAVQVMYGCVVFPALIAFLLYGFLYPSRRRKRRIKELGLHCPACGRSLVANLDCERLVAGTGECWACGARVLGSPCECDPRGEPRTTITLPARFPSNPPWWLIPTFAAVPLMTLLFAAAGLHVVTGLWILAGVLAMVAVLFLLRRVVWIRHLDLLEDAMLLPTGLLLAHVVRIPYDAIEHVEENRTFCTVLYLRSGRTYGILKGTMLDGEAYASVRDFLLEVASRNEKEIPVKSP